MEEDVTEVIKKTKNKQKTEKKFIVLCFDASELIFSEVITFKLGINLIDSSNLVAFG